ncbi:GNAT family N-acetyltransferase [Paenibacillus sp. MER 99-2]|uniref:GNAT family N-acetyltransferase n=1 Tax=Paenibacillus sp. MER 99-2 TaxID=2939572 RepID=UPI00203B9B69|nr:GNAT family N-acetyltransferase [Paenibacillus sp. MER 99-2]MCM3171631.1 GNAT family N-acetyltransferase [Paenibacillus sp. MER 99-2]
MTQFLIKPTVSPVQVHQIQEAIDFAMRVRREVFTMLDHTRLPLDLEQFSAHYMESKDAIFLVATVGEGQIVGSIGILPYDDRIEAIQGRYPQESAAEIVKCYVDPAYRRYGIGSMMLQALENRVIDMRYTTLYLHTHHFLPGAVDFWKRQGFTIITEQNDDWQTVHMDKPAGKIELT